MRDLTWQHARNVVRRLRSWWTRRQRATAHASATDALQQRRDRAAALYNIDRSRWN